MPASFFDTNVIVYLTSADELKANRAEALISAGGTISVQVLNEIANVARRKLNFTWPEVRAFIQPFRDNFAIVELTDAIHVHALRLAERHGFAIHDSMIVAAALSAGCDILWSEDMHDGLVVDDRLTIRNPF